jgi:uncharacterized protein with HEPN domain
MRKTFTGPRGGVYSVTPSGNKVYAPKKISVDNREKRHIKSIIKELDNIMSWIKSPRDFLESTKRDKYAVMRSIVIIGENANRIQAYLNNSSGTKINMTSRYKTRLGNFITIRNCIAHSIDDLDNLVSSAVKYCDVNVEDQVYDFLSDNSPVEIKRKLEQVLN